MKTEDAGADIAVVLAMMAGYELERMPEPGKPPVYRCQFCGIVSSKKDHPAGMVDCPVTRARKVILAARDKTKRQ